MDLRELDKEFQTRIKILYELYKKKIFDFERVQEVIEEYKKNPKKVLKDLGLQKG